MYAFRPLQGLVLAVLFVLVMTALGWANTPASMSSPDAVPREEVEDSPSSPPPGGQAVSPVPENTQQMATYGVTPTLQGQAVNIQLIDRDSKRTVDRVRRGLLERPAPSIGMSRAVVEAVWGPNQAAVLSPGRNENQAIYTNQFELVGGHLLAHNLSMKNRQAYEVTYTPAPGTAPPLAAMAQMPPAQTAAGMAPTAPEQPASDPATEPPQPTQQPSMAQQPPPPQAAMALSPAMGTQQTVVRVRAVQTPVVGDHVAMYDYFLGPPLAISNQGTARVYNIPPLLLGDKTIWQARPDQQLQVYTDANSRVIGQELMSVALAGGSNEGLTSAQRYTSSALGRRFAGSVAGNH
jgi:hypothetical protein